MDKDNQMSAEQAFADLRDGTTAIVDVRSESEFAKGHFAGTTNIPILNNEHRHIVGLTYKNQGQKAAVTCGHELVDPIRTNLVAAWIEALGPSPAVGTVMCWRGGQRSEIACRWLGEAGVPVRQVIGGYKAVRREVLNKIAEKPEVIVLAGYTGSRKTDLLETTTTHINLEALARHRGSAFGNLYGVTQPAQATFENNLALELAKLQGKERPILVEDESHNVGKCFLPIPLINALVTAPTIWLDVPLEQRMANIYEDYVARPLGAGISGSDLLQHYLTAVSRVRKSLGGSLTTVITKALTDAFDQSPDLSSHRAWIEPLLVEYYDRRYRHGCERMERPNVFQGDRDSVSDFLAQRGYL